MIRDVMRWLIVPIAALAVWCVALILGIGGVAVLDAWCPPEQMVSGLCTAPWHAPAVDALTIAMAALAAFGIVAVPAWTAPSHGVIVAAAMFTLGATFAASIAIEGDMPGAFAGAAVGGTAGLLLAIARRRAAPKNVASQA